MLLLVGGAAESVFAGTPPPAAALASNLGPIYLAALQQMQQTQPATVMKFPFCMTAIGLLCLPSHGANAPCLSLSWLHVVLVPLKLVFNLQLYLVELIQVSATLKLA